MNNLIHHQYSINMRIMNILFIASLFIISCQKAIDLPADESVVFTNTQFPNVDERLWVHFSTFEEEALKRGWAVDLIKKGIHGIVKDIEEQNVAGMCSFGSHQPQLVTIDALFFERADYLYREFIVFHELGHCALFRNHDESQNRSGICVSIMRSGLGGCRDNYHEGTREGYLDELFGEIIL